MTIAMMEVVKIARPHLRLLQCGGVRRAMRGEPKCRLTDRIDLRLAHASCTLQAYAGAARAAFTSWFGGPTRKGGTANAEASIYTSQVHGDLGGCNDDTGRGTFRSHSRCGRQPRPRPVGSLGAWRQ